MTNVGIFVKIFKICRVFSGNVIFKGLSRIDLLKIGPSVSYFQ